MTTGIILGLATALILISGGSMALTAYLTRTYTGMIERASTRQLQQIAEITHRAGPESSALAAALLAPRPKQEDSKPVREIELPVPADLAWPPDPEEFRENSDGF